MRSYEEIKNKIEEYYLQDSIIKYFQLFGLNREVVPVYKSLHYGKRPSMMQYDTDYKLAISEGATSFHCSVERWKSVSFLKNVQDNKNALDDIREGWDVIIDIDAKKDLEDAKTVCSAIVHFLQDVFEIHPIYVKFSGNRGFHIGIHGNSLPQEINNTPIAKQYPELLHKISIYIKEKVYEILRKEGKEKAFKEVEVEDNWSYRHLFRMPYSLNEKTWLVSTVIDVEEIQEFKKDFAVMESVDKLKPFLKEASKGDVDLLCLEAIEYYENSRFIKELNKTLSRSLELKKYGIEDESLKIQELKQEIKKIKGGIKQKIDREHFPKTILNILEGLEDGRKRGLFILLNFLRKMNWTWEEIEKEIEEWNKRNKEPLKENYIRAQINYFKRNEEKIKNILPPNFETSGYYDDIGILDKRDMEMGVKNPVTYAYKKLLSTLKGKRYGKYNNNRNPGNRENQGK